MNHCAVSLIFTHPFISVPYRTVLYCTVPRELPTLGPKVPYLTYGVYGGIVLL